MGLRLLRAGPALSRGSNSRLVYIDRAPSSIFSRQTYGLSRTALKMVPTQLAQALMCSSDRAMLWCDPLNAAMRKFGIVGSVETASFLAQLSHESADLTRLTENLNYSALGLCNTWPSRYRDHKTGKPNALAYALHRRPTAIANHCYANRMGNGNEASGDGWRYRGRGPIMITGLSNYRACGLAIGADLVSHPELLLDPKYGALAAGWFWHVNGLDAHDDDFDVLRETKIINGGTTGLADRQNQFNRILRVFNK